MRAFAQLGRSRVAMEACASAHHWARRLGELGHEVVLLPPQHVKGYLRGQKNDYNDAEAIAEACLHGRIRAVVPKTLEEQDRQSFYRMRQQLVGEQTRLINHIRGLLAEYGVVIARGKARFRAAVPAVLAEADHGLTPRVRELLARQLARYHALVEELAWYTHQLEQQVKADALCQRLMTVPGFGPVVSGALRHWMGDGKQFRRGRDAAAALGLVPRQHTSGGKPLLGGITKKGDAQLRALLVHGARAVVRQAHKKDDRLSRWVRGLVERRGMNKATVALANKLARIAWVVVTRAEIYRPQRA